MSARDEGRRDYIIGCLRAAGAMYAEDARAYLAEYDAAHRAEVRRADAAAIDRWGRARGHITQTVAETAAQIAERMRQWADTAGKDTQPSESPPADVNHTLYLAEYEGASDGPTLWTSEDAARAYCNDYAESEAGGRAWDWGLPDEDGVLQQVWCRDLDDRPTGAAPGRVTPLTVQGGEQS